MSKLKKTIGFDVIYPPNCKDVHEGLKADELKRRLTELQRALETMSERCCQGQQDSLLNDTKIDDSTIDLESNLEGLFLHLTSEQFVDHHDREVQLRVAVCLCYIIKIVCPSNPFACYSDSDTVTKAVLHFLLKCIEELCRVKSKSDKLFMAEFTVLSICCEIDIFHFYTTLSDGDAILSETFHVFFNVVKRSHDWSDDMMVSKMVTDAMINLLSSPEAPVSDTLVTYLLNILVDRCSTKLQKQIVLEVFTKCINKLEEQIQMVLQNLLIKSEKEDEISDSSDNDDVNNDDDDFCSLDSYKMRLKKAEKIKPKLGKVELGKDTIEHNIEYACHHAFQMIFEMFKINEGIVIPLLPTIEMKLRSTQVTDRKRACRLIGKLFSSSSSNDSPNQSSLWETFLGRLSDIEVEVREICVRVARDLLKSALESPNNCGIMNLEKEREELIKAFQKRSNDQDESIRYLIVLAVSQILEQSKTIVKEEELDMVSEAMFKLLLHQSRDKFLSVRKEAHSTMGKLYRKIISDVELKSNDSDLTLGLRNLLPGQRSRVELLLNLIMRPYLSAEVEDRIVVERLFNTSLVSYGKDSSSRMKSLLQCLTLCDEPSVLCIHEMFKTQVTVMNIVRQTVDLLGDVSSDRAISPSLSQKLREKVKKLAEYLSSKDKVDSLTKFFNQARSDKKLNDLLRRFVDKSSTRPMIVKTIMDIKKLFPLPTSKTSSETNNTALTKRKAFIGTIKCILERGAPIIFDTESVQELLSHCVATKEASECSATGGQENSIVPLSRTLRLLHTILIMSRKLVPLQEAYEYLVTVMRVFEVTEGETKDTSRGVPEDLCLQLMCKMVECSQPLNNVESGEVDSAVDQDIAVASGNGLFCDEGHRVVETTRSVLRYLERCCLKGSTVPLGTVTVARGRWKSKKDSQEKTELCKWIYDCKVAKLSSQCLVGLVLSCQQAMRFNNQDNDQISGLLDEINTLIGSIIKKSCECEQYSTDQPVLLTCLSHISGLLPQHFQQEIRDYAKDVVPGLLSDDMVDKPEISVSKNLTLWQPEAEVSKVTQVKIQALKLLSRWVVTLKADIVSDQKCIVYVMSSLRKYIGNYGTEGYSGDVSDSEMSHLRLSAGKCWLRVAQVQSFLPIFDVNWIYRLSSLVYDPCTQVRDEFLRKLHIGLFKLKLPLEYMAMFVFVPKVKNQEYLNMAKRYLQTNVTRRRDFLDTYPEYLSDAKKLFGVLPEYVMSFVIHMLAHDHDWKNVEDDECLCLVKQCLWFVMEPILKLNENYSFIRKLLERIKHAQDAAVPNDKDMNERLYICSDIALGLLITKQSSYDLKEYPVELKLPRTRYIPAPNTFFNPDFANILVDNGTRARIQFSPNPKSKQMIKSCMPPILMKGNHHNNELLNKEDYLHEDVSVEHNIQLKSSVLKTKKHIAKIVIGLPEIESEGISEQYQSVQLKKMENTRKAAAPRQKISRQSDSSPPSEVNSNQTSVTTKRGRICKPNFLVMKDMVSPKKRVPSPAKELKKAPAPSVRIEGTVSVNIERLISDVIQQTLTNTNESNKENDGNKISPKNKEVEVNPTTITTTTTTTKEIEKNNKNRKQQKTNTPVNEEIAEKINKKSTILDIGDESSLEPKRLTRHSWQSSEQLNTVIKSPIKKTILARSLIQDNVEENEQTKLTASKVRLTRNTAAKLDSPHLTISKQSQELEKITPESPQKIKKNTRVVVMKTISKDQKNEKNKTRKSAEKEKIISKSIQTKTDYKESPAKRRKTDLLTTSPSRQNERVTRRSAQQNDSQENVKETLKKKIKSPIKLSQEKQIRKLSPTKSSSSLSLQGGDSSPLAGRRIVIVNTNSRLSPSPVNLSPSRVPLKKGGTRVQRAPLELVVRSKRLAGQAATEELIKKMRKM